jgi:NAD(P)-dependent dehydrogenase (short-subunit alcohol dehydrogenase family)
MSAADGARLLAGRAAIVTGASRGIGLAIAQRLVEQGASVVITSRNAEHLLAAKAQLDADGQVEIVAGHAADDSHQAEATTVAIERFGRIDYLVNNAGINPSYAPLMETSLEVVRKTFDTNVAASLGWVQHVHRAWMGEHGGAILNVASIAGLRPAPMIGAYAISKAAFVHLTAQLALELAPKIRVNAVAPAVVRTRFARALFDGREDEVAAGYPLRRLGAPEDVAGAATFLLSEAADWVTGQTLVLDGGLTVTSTQEA